MIYPRRFTDAEKRKETISYLFLLVNNYCNSHGVEAMNSMTNKMKLMIGLGMLTLTVGVPWGLIHGAEVLESLSPNYMIGGVGIASAIGALWLLRIARRSSQESEN